MTHTFLTFKSIHEEARHILAVRSGGQRVGVITPSIPFKRMLTAKCDDILTLARLSYEATCLPFSWLALRACLHHPLFSLLPKPVPIGPLMQKLDHALAYKMDVSLDNIIHYLNDTFTLEETKYLLCSIHHFQELQRILACAEDQMDFNTLYAHHLRWMGISPPSLERYALGAPDYGSFLRLLSQHKDKEQWAQIVDVESLWLAPPNHPDIPALLPKTNTLFVANANEETWLPFVSPLPSLTCAHVTRALFEHALIQTPAPFWVLQAKTVQDKSCSSSALLQPAVTPPAPSYPACPLSLTLLETQWLLENPDLFYKKYYLQLPSSHSPVSTFGKGLLSIIKKCQWKQLEEAYPLILQEAQIQRLTQDTATLQRCVREWQEVMMERRQRLGIGYSHMGVPVQTKVGPIGLTGKLDHVDIDDQGRCWLVVYGGRSPSSSTESNAPLLQALLAQAHFGKNAVCGLTVMGCGYTWSITEWATSGEEVQKEVNKLQDNLYQACEKKEGPHHSAACPCAWGRFFMASHERRSHAVEL